jgi:hypothetical protein
MSVVVKEDGRIALLLRATAALAGLCLVAMAAVSLYLSIQAVSFVHGQFEAGDRLVSDLIDGSHPGATQARLEHALAGGLHWIANHTISQITGLSRGFEVLAALAILAGAVAFAAALKGRPQARWPERVWLACAFIALLPAVLAHPWVIPGFPLAALLAFVAVMHMGSRKQLARRALAAAPSVDFVGAKAREAGTAAKTATENVVNVALMKGLPLVDRVRDRRAAQVVAPPTVPPTAADFSAGDPLDQSR